MASGDFNLSEKDAVVTIGIDISMKHKAALGTSDKLMNFLSDLEKLIKEHSSDEVFFKSSLGNVLTHKEKAKK